MLFLLLFSELVLQSDGGYLMYYVFNPVQLCINYIELHVSLQLL